MITKNQNTKTPSYSFDESNQSRLVTRGLIDEIVEIGKATSRNIFYWQRRFDKKKLLYF
jgi:hypothetical protein